jgi:hypothetical protein
MSSFAVAKDLAKMGKKLLVVGVGLAAAIFG